MARILLLLALVILLERATSFSYNTRYSRRHGNKMKLYAGSASSSNIMIEFQPANKTVSAIIGDDISEVALVNEVEIPYQCRKGECGTCLINMDGKWVKACQTKVTVNDPKQKLIKILVKPKKKKARFFSPRSFLDGVINNALGVVGFVVEARKARKEFKARMKREQDLAEKVAARKREKESKD